ncbi:MAG: 4,5-DOPA dioxygenase extradiol [Myxococcales bacterium]|nr:4,5-DOPA dioxygenase extradiol [Myxococcales bacterium]
MPTTQRMPVLFVGHGSPMNAIEDNPWSRGFAALRELVPRPTAVLAISAHWFVDGTWLTAEPHPQTIHDFGGFPRALFEVEYPAPGRAALATRVRDLLRERGADLRTDWGLDHGTWSVLCRMYPDADVPVVQLSLDRRLSPRAHLELARDLAALRDEGVLVLGSGNVTHNLRDAFRRMQTGDHETPDWARRFDGELTRALEQHDDAAIVAMSATDDGRLAHPTPDHWLPLIYALGATDERDAVSYPIEGFDIGSLSMRAVRWG